MSERAPDPYGAHRFRVACDALPGLGFAEVRGLSVRVETTPEGDERAAPNRRPWWALGGRVGRRRGSAPERRVARSPTLTLRRGVTDDDAPWRWLQDWLDGAVTPQDVRICLLDDAGDPVRGWVCRGARPVRWRGPDLDASRPAVATETLELAHDRLEALDDPTVCEEPRE